MVEIIKNVNSAEIPSLLLYHQSRQHGIEPEAIEGDWKPIEKPLESSLRNPIDPALQAKTAEVVKLFGQGVTNKADILLAVWNVRPGRSINASV